MPTITITTKKAGVLTNATSVILSNFAGTAGIIRNDTGAVVVADGTAFANPSTGTYTYDFTAPAEYVFYTATIETIASGSTTHREVIFFVSAGSATVIVPSAILAEYIITTLGTFSAVSAATTWPLFRSNLPDGRNINDDIGAIFDTTPNVQAKMMDGEIDQRYGIQVMIRSKVYDDGYIKAKELLQALKGISRVEVVVGGTTFRIDNISTITGILPLGVENETKQRSLFSLNLLVTIKES